MLRVEGLRAGHGDIEVVHGVDLHVGDAEMVALIGSNGAGKTTTLDAVCGLLAVRAGDVRLAGESVVGRPTARLVRAGLAYVPAARHLFGQMSVGVNLELGCYPRRPDRDRLARVFDLFPRLADRRSQLAGTLSGGEQQMLAIGRALMAAPRMLVLDEPTTGLAPGISEEVYAAIVGLRDARSVAVLVAEQHVPLVLGMADRAYVLEDGRVRLSGRADALARDPEVRRAYLGID